MTNPGNQTRNNQSGKKRSWSVTRVTRSTQQKGILHPPTHICHVPTPTLAKEGDLAVPVLTPGQTRVPVTSSKPYTIQIITQGSRDTGHGAGRPNTRVLPKRPEPGRFLGPPGLRLPCLETRRKPQNPHQPAPIQEEFPVPSRQGDLPQSGKPLSPQGL